MAKKHKHEEHENHERWLVSYADFITLLFAFFVVMYSVSAINEGKFRTVSESIKAALNPVVTEQVANNHFNLGNFKSSLVPSIVEKKGRIIRTVEKMVKKLEGDMRMRGKIVAAPTKNGVLITIPDNLLFESGRADVNQEALPILEALATVLADSAHELQEITVQGHTDNVPIRTAQFPSNWELSTARAVTVVRILTERYNSPATKISASGHAEFKPVVDNLSPENRMKNRRVEVLLIMQDAPTGETPSRIDVSAEPGSPEPGNSEPIVPIPSLLEPPIPAEMVPPAEEPAPAPH
jgi:chemotaxis protein MotB